MDKKISKIIFRQDSSTNMENVILDLGEPGIGLIDNSLGVFKIGDGKSKFKDLPTLSTTHIIEEPTQNGEFLRKKQDENYSWIPKDSRKSLADLLAAPYDLPLNMNYKVLDSSGVERTVWGIKRSFTVSVNANILDKKILVGNVYSIIDFNGYVVAGNEGKISITADNETCKSSIYVNTNNELVLDTLAICDRLDNKIDVWVLYTEVAGI